MSTSIEEMESRGLKLPFYWEDGMYGGGCKPLPQCHSSNQKHLTMDKDWEE